MNTVSDKVTASAGLKLPNPCGAHVLARALKRHGVEVLFGQSLPSALLLVIPEFGMRQIAYRTENAGAAMARSLDFVSWHEYFQPPEKIVKEADVFRTYLKFPTYNRA